MYIKLHNKIEVSLNGIMSPSIAVTMTIALVPRNYICEAYAHKMVVDIEMNSSLDS